MAGLRLPKAGISQCGEIQSRVFFTMARLKDVSANRAPGLNPSVFTYVGRVHVTSYDEINIEILPREPGEMTVNTYVVAKPRSGTTVTTASSFDQEFHAVPFRWEPERIIRHLDGQEVYCIDLGSELPRSLQELYMLLLEHNDLNRLAGETGPAQEGPLGYEADWVIYTRLGKACQFEESITCPQE